MQPQKRQKKKCIIDLCQAISKSTLLTCRFSDFCRIRPLLKIFQSCCDLFSECSLSVTTFAFVILNYFS